jgi:hypothetical protein
MRSKASKLMIITGGVVGAISIALAAKTLVDTSSVPPPPKPYDVAMYEVYSALIPNTEESWLNRLIDPPPQEVLIRAETLASQNSGINGAYGPSPEGRPVPEQRLKQAVDSAIADYLKRNTTILELQRKFNLPHYDLFTASEQRSINKGDASGGAFQEKPHGYERWIELSSVGFNQDQTVAVVYFVETRGSFWKAGYRMLQKRGGKWRLLANRVFSDVVS